MFATLGRLVRRKRRPKFQIELRFDRIEKYPFEDLDLIACWNFGKYKGRTRSAKVDIKQEATWNEHFTMSSVKVDIDKRTCQPKEAIIRIVVFCGKIAVGKLSFDLTMFLSARTWQSERFALRKTGSNCQIVLSVKATQIQGTPLFHTRPDLLPRNDNNIASPVSDTDFSTIASLDPALQSSLLDQKHITSASKPDPGTPGPVSLCKATAASSKVAKAGSSGFRLISELLENVLAQGETEDELEEYRRTRFGSRISSELLGQDSFRFNTI